MKSWFFTITAALFIAASAAAAGIPQLMGVGAPPSVAATYTGPGDIVSGATAWYSLRAYSAAVAATGTQNAVDLRRASDSGTCTAKIATSGSIDLTVGTPCAGATVTAFCNATSCFVSKWYDQSGNTRDASQGTAATQPQLAFNAINTTLPCLTFSGSQYFTFAHPTVAQTWTVSAVAKRTNTTRSAIVGRGGIYDVGYSTGANLAELAATTITNTAASDSVFHALAYVANGSSSVIRVDGAASGSLNPSTNSISGSPSGLGATESAAIPLTGSICEAMVYPVAANVSANQKSYYGTP